MTTKRKVPKLGQESVSVIQTTWNHCQQPHAVFEKTERDRYSLIDKVDAITSIVGHLIHQHNCVGDCKYPRQCVLNKWLVLKLYLHF